MLNCSTILVEPCAQPCAQQWPTLIALRAASAVTVYSTESVISSIGYVYSGLQVRLPEIGYIAFDYCKSFPRHVALDRDLLSHLLQILSRYVIVIPKLRLFLLK